MKNLRQKIYEQLSGQSELVIVKHWFTLLAYSATLTALEFARQKSGSGLLFIAELITGLMLILWVKNKVDMAIVASNPSVRLYDRYSPKFKKNMAISGLSTVLTTLLAWGSVETAKEFANAEKKDECHIQAPLSDDPEPNEHNA